MFVFTLVYLSPRAFNYIRQKFKNNLPHPATIRKWFLNSSATGEPGICGTSLSIIKKLVTDQKAKGEDLYCTLAFDEMSIRRHVQWLNSQKKFSGFINFGNISSEKSEHLPVASHAKVFMLNGINLKFNLPVAFYFIKTLDGMEKVVLISAILKEMCETGAKVLVVDFDGLATNIKATEIMGANFDLEDLRPFFNHSYDPLTVFVFFDVPHMIKLVRNALAQYKIMVDSEGRTIEWRFFEKLVEIGLKSDFVSHKMNQAHLDVTRNAMRVGLAAQTLSSSVASSMKSLMDRGNSDFQGCAGTIKFIKMFDKIFDVLNSDVFRADNIYKTPITPSSKDRIFNFLDKAVGYIKGLTFFDGTPAIQHERKTGFKGIIADIVNVKSIYTQFVETGKFDTFPVRKTNQDPVESLFGRCRSYSVLGNNTNPTVQQFQSSIRRLLISNEITSSNLSNCDDDLNILFVSSDRPKKDNTTVAMATPGPSQEKSLTTEPSDPDEHEYSEFMFQTRYRSITEDDRYGIAYIAGVIENKILSYADFNCKECEMLFMSKEKLEITSFPKNRNSRIPCKFTFEICMWTYNTLKPELLKLNFDYSTLLLKILNVDHVQFYRETDFNTHEGHDEILTKFIAEEFINAECTYTAKLATYNEQLKLDKTRNKKKANKVAHFQGR